MISEIVSISMNSSDLDVPLSLEPASPEAPVRPSDELPTEVDNLEKPDEESQENNDTPSSDSEEVVNMATVVESNGDINLKFSSHGKHHELKLKDTGRLLGDIPIKLLGSSSKFQQRVNDEMQVSSQAGYQVLIG